MKKIYNEEFCFLPRFCEHCGQQITLKKEFIRTYESRGYPKLKHGHYLIINNPMKDPEVSKKIKGQANPMSRTSKNQRKIKIAVSRLEKIRLETIEKQKQGIIIEKKEEILSINPQKKNILCPKVGIVKKVCFRTGCKEYSFCHSMKNKIIKTHTEERYSSTIKELTKKYR